MYSIVDGLNNVLTYTHRYRRCSKYSLQSGLFDKAVNYAKKERDIEQYCIGADTAKMPHLEKDLKGAEFWFKHVLDERTKGEAAKRANEKWLQEEMTREAREAQAAAKAKKGDKAKGGKGSKGGKGKGKKK